MTRSLSFFLCLGLASAGALSGLTQAQSSFQSPPIGTIDFYGLRTISQAQVMQALRIKVGDAVPDSPVPARLRLEAIPGVARAGLNFVCCEAGKAIMYVGIAEKGTPALEFRPAPTGSVHLYDDVLKAGEAFDKAFSDAISLGDFAEDDLAGHSLMHYPPARAVQMQFIKLAALHLPQLRDVLRNSSSADQRALAAQVIAYAANKKDVVDDLIYGMRDPSEEVRNKSIRALWLIAMLTQRSPELQIHVPPAPFIDLLNSIVWTDLNKSSLALLEITDNRDPATLAELQKRALPSLVDIARWKAMGHAQAGLYILGRIAGLSEKEIQADCDRGDRDAIISAAIKAGKAK